MFTGIIEEVGHVTRVRPGENGRELTIAASSVLDDLTLGDSLALDGACQTVVARSESDFTVLAIHTTLGRTTLGAFEPGRAVNLERAMPATGRFGGHWVQGHVDGIGTVREVRREGESVLVTLLLPEVARPLTVLHGSLAVDGVSLTVNALSEGGEAQVALIPYTYAHTNLSRLRPGDRVNVEGDLVGKYVARWLAYTRGAESEGPPHRESEFPR